MPTNDPFDVVFRLGFSVQKLIEHQVPLGPWFELPLLSFFPGLYCLSGGSVALRAAGLSLCFSSPVVPPLGPAFLSTTSLLILFPNFVDGLFPWIDRFWFYSSVHYFEIDRF